MLSIVVWKWKGTRPYTSHQVNVLKEMIDKHYTDEHEVVCVTDDAKGLHPDIRVIDLPPFEHLPVMPGLPSCFVRPWGFSEEFGKLIGNRFVTLDIDVIIKGDMRPVWNMPGEFIAWCDPDIRGVCYQGGMYLMEPGARATVYDEFDPATSPDVAAKAGFIGSDQAWISYCLAPHEREWTRADGVFRFRNINSHDDLERARIVQFAGRVKPWTCSYEAPWLYAMWKLAEQGT